MKKRRSPVYHSRRRGSGLRSFFVTLLGAAAIAVLGAGVWQLLDPVEYQPPLAPLAASALAASKSDQPDQTDQTDPPEEKDTPPPDSSSGSQDPASSGDPPEDGEDDQKSSDPQVAEGEWLASEYFDDALFVGDSITEGIKLYDVMSNVTVLASTGVNVATLQLNLGSRGGQAVMVIECDKAVPTNVVEEIRALPGIQRVTSYIPEGQEETV